MDYSLFITVGFITERDLICRVKIRLVLASPPRPSEPGCVLPYVHPASLFENIRVGPDLTRLVSGDDLVPTACAGYFVGHCTLSVAVVLYELVHGHIRTHVLDH